MNRLSKALCGALYTGAFVLGVSYAIDSHADDTRCQDDNDCTVLDPIGVGGGGGGGGGGWPGGGGPGNGGCSLCGGGDPGGAGGGGGGGGGPIGGANHGLTAYNLALMSVDMVNNTFMAAVRDVNYFRAIGLNSPHAQGSLINWAALQINWNLYGAANPQLTAQEVVQNFVQAQQGTGP